MAPGTPDPVSRFVAWAWRHPNAWEHVCAAPGRGEAIDAAWAEVWDAAMEGRLVLAWMEPASAARN